MLMGLLSTLGYQTLTHQEKDEKKMDDEEHMFIWLEYIYSKLQTIIN